MSSLPNLPAGPAYPGRGTPERLYAFLLAALVLVSITVLLLSGQVSPEYRGAAYGLYLTVLAWFATPLGK